jgi:hypothetical protein
MHQSDELGLGMSRCRFWTWVQCQSATGHGGQGRSDDAGGHGEQGGTADAVLPKRKN